MPGQRRVSADERAHIMDLADRGRTIAQIASLVGRPVATVEHLVARERRKEMARGVCKMKSWRCGGGVVRDGLCVYHAAVMALRLKQRDRGNGVEV